MSTAFGSLEELQQKLGNGLRAMRLGKNVTQAELAAKAGVAPRSLTNLENGLGSSVDTLVRVLKALDAADAIERLAPQPTVSPMAMLRTPTPPRRARKPRQPRPLP